MEWIETEKELPKDVNVVLVWIPDVEGMRTAYYYDGFWFVTGSGSKLKQDVSHWMPLPEPPPYK